MPINLKNLGNMTGDPILTGVKDSSSSASSSASSRVSTYLKKLGADAAQAQFPGAVGRVANVQDKVDWMKELTAKSGFSIAQKLASEVMPNITNPFFTPSDGWKRSVSGIHEKLFPKFTEFRHMKDHYLELKKNVMVLLKGPWSKPAASAIMSLFNPAQAFKLFAKDAVLGQIRKAVGGSLGDMFSSVMRDMDPTSKFAGMGLGLDSLGSLGNLGDALSGFGNIGQAFGGIGGALGNLDGLTGMMNSGGLQGVLGNVGLGGGGNLAGGLLSGFAGNVGSDSSLLGLSGLVSSAGNLGSITGAQGVLGGASSVPGALSNIGSMFGNIPSSASGSISNTIQGWAGNLSGGQTPSSVAGVLSGVKSVGTSYGAGSKKINIKPSSFGVKLTGAVKQVTDSLETVSVSGPKEEEFWPPASWGTNLLETLNVDGTLPLVDDNMTATQSLAAGTGWGCIERPKGYGGEADYVKTCTIWGGKTYDEVQAEQMVKAQAIYQTMENILEKTWGSGGETKTVDPAFEQAMDLKLSSHDIGYTHKQNDPSEKWTIPNSVSKLDTDQITITVYDQDGFKLQEDEAGVDSNYNVTLLFSKPVSGKVVITKAINTPKQVKAITLTEVEETIQNGSAELIKNETPYPRTGVDTAKVDMRDPVTANKVFEDMRTQASTTIHTTGMTGEGGVIQNAQLPGVGTTAAQEQR